MVDNDVLKSDLRKQYTQLDYELDRCSSLYEVITEEDYEDFKRYYSKYEFTDLALAHDKFYDVTTYFKLMIKNRKSLENSDKTVGPSKLKGAKFVILTPIGLSETGELSFVYRRYDISEADISYISAAYKKIKKAELTNSDKLRILSEITYKRVKSILESLSSDKKESLPFGEKITLTELKQIYEDEEFNMDSWSKFNSIRLDARDELLTTSCIKVLQKGTNGVSQDETLSKKVEETEQEGYGLSELIDEVYETAITDDDSIIMSDNKVTPDDNDIKDSKDEEEVQSLSSILDEINSTAVSFSNLKSSSEEVNQSDSNDDTSDITSLNGQDEDLSSILSEINTTALSSDEEERTDDEVVDSSDEQDEDLSSILSEINTTALSSDEEERTDDEVVDSSDEQDEDLSSILSEIGTTALSSDEEEKTDDEVVVDSSDEQDEDLSSILSEINTTALSSDEEERTDDEVVDSSDEQDEDLSSILSEINTTALSSNEEEKTDDEVDSSDEQDEDLSSILSEINTTALSSNEEEKTDDEVVDSSDEQDEELSSILSEIGTTTLSSDEEEKTEDEVVVDSSDEQDEELSSILSEVGEPLTYEQLLSAVGNGEEKSRFNEEKTGESKDGLQSSFVEVKFNVNPESENESKKGGDENNHQDRSDDEIDEELSAILSDLTSSSVPFQRQSSQRESQYNMPDFQIDDSIFSVLTNENLDDFYFHNVSDDSINPENKRKK